MDEEAVRLRYVPGGVGEVCKQILTTLPAWFGIEQANREYAAVAERSTGVVASVEDADIGLLVVTHHSPYSAEIHLMAVRPEWHRQGIGRRLVERAEHALALEGVEYLQVKTLSESHVDAGYAKTRAFYGACGFRALEEFPTLWDPASPALQMIKAIRPPPPPITSVSHT